nr:transcriptional regulator, ArsR family [uncultured bacterium]
MDEVFKALSDANRRQLLDELFVSNGQTLTELCGHLDVTRQGVAKHLAILEEANLVVTVWRGREKLHYLNPIPISEIYERWIGKFERQRLQALGDLKKKLESNQNQQQGESNE